MNATFYLAKHAPSGLFVPRSPYGSRNDAGKDTIFSSIASAKGAITKFIDAQGKYRGKMYSEEDFCIEEYTLSKTGVTIPYKKN